MSHRRETTRAVRRSIPLAASGWVALMAGLLAPSSVVRPVAVFGFVLFCPGGALLRTWPGKDVLERLTLIVALSTAVALLVAETLIIIHAWTPWGALTILAAVTTVAAMIPRETRR